MTDNKNKPAIIFVLGMHRSGTSLVAQMVARWGANMGNDLMKADWYNQEGYWEYNPLVNLHEKMLAYTGNTWYAPPQRIDVPNLIDVFGSEALALVDEMDAGQNTWCWKDPRMALFLPFWQELLKDRELLYVYSYRNPLSVAVSLKTRNSIPTIITTALWEIYTLKIFEALKSSDACFFAQYEKLIDKPDELTKHLYDFLNTQIHEQKGSDILQKMRAAIKPGLKHSLPSQNISIDKQQADLYTLLQHEQIPEKDIEYLHTRLNYALEITDLYHKGNYYKERNLQLQLFYKQKGKSYSEDDSFVKKYEPNTQQLVFEFDELSGIEFLRFDPLTDWVQCSCGELDLYHNNKHVAKLQAVSHNATKVFADSLFFASRDPQVYFKTDQLEDVLFNKAIIRFKYLKVGTQCKIYFAENPTLFFDDLLPNKQGDSKSDYSLMALYRQVSDKIQDFENRILQSENLLKQKEKTLEEYNEQIEELEERTSNKREKISVLESRTQILKQQQQKLTLELEENVEQNKHLLNELQDAKAHIDSLKHELTSKQQALLQAQNRENEQNETINKLNNTIQQNLLELNEKKKTIQNYEEQYMELSQKLQSNEQQIQAERKRLQQELKHTNNTLNRLMANERTKLVRQYHRCLPLRLAGNLWRFIKNPLQYYRMRRDTLVVRRSGLFDDGWYLQQYPDLYLTTVDMLQHYMLYGAAEGRNPNPMFDANYYLNENPDVKEAGINPLLHYVLYGWNEKRNPSLNFDTKYYLDNNPDVKNAKVNPLAHYLKFGLLEERNPKDVNEKVLNNQENNNTIERSSGIEPIDRLLSESEYQQICNEIINCKENKLSIELIAKRTGLFNEKYYSNFVNNSEITDLFNHYVNKGYLIGLNPSNIFNTKQYYEANMDVYWANMNPLEHFIKYGYLENRKFFCSDIIDPKYKRFFGRSEYGMTGPDLAYDEEVKLNENFNLSIGVHLHLYYIDLAEELLVALSNIPYTFSLFISTPHGVKEQSIIKEIIHENLPLCAKYKIVQFENRGRDIAPFIVEFGKELLNFDIVLHYHSKKSLHSDGLADARRFLLHYILGNKSIVTQILNLFFADERNGIICPPYHPTLRNLPNFGKQENEIRLLLKQLEISYGEGECLDFPAGSFFWCRKKAIEPLLTHNILLTDFPEEQGQVDGTLAHVIERAFGIITIHNGYKVLLPYIDIPHNLINYYYDNRRFTQLLQPEKKNIKENKYKNIKNKIAYVTAIFGDFDNLLIPKNIEHNIDYYCFTDNPTLTNDIFKIKNVADYHNDDKRMLARYVKTNTLRLLPDYDYIIWIDANIYFKGLVNDFINELDKNKMFIGGISHNVRKDCFSEALECINMKLDHKDKIEKQMFKYLDLPDDELEALKRSRLIETNFMVLKKSEETIIFQKIWWSEIESHSKRDQISVNYSLIMANLDYYPLLNEKKTVRDDYRFAMFAHKRKNNENSSKKELLSINYRNHNDMLNTLKGHLVYGRFDNYNLIVGIPRSGMIPAYHLGQFLNLPVLSFDEFISEIDPIKGDRKLSEQDSSTNDKIRVLFIDDSINNGNAYKRFINNLPKGFKGKNFTWDYLAVYGSESANKSLFIEFCPTPRIFQWNYKNHPLSQYFCYDMDGVLCIDPTEEQNDDGEKYIEFIKNAKPLYIPNYHIKAIVTSRLEKYRSFTEKWLVDNNVRYGKLYMLNLPSKEERIRLNAHASFKSEVYSKIEDSILFVESNDKQAKVIAEKTGKKVICTENDIMYS